MFVFLLFLEFLLVSPFGGMDRNNPQRRFTGTSFDHPLNSLSPNEIKQVFDLLTSHNSATPDQVYPSVFLQDPAKSEVLAWKAGGALPKRRVWATVVSATKISEVTINLSDNIVEAWNLIPPGSGQPTLGAAEFSNAIGPLMVNTVWTNKLIARGFDPKTTPCFPLTAGYFPQYPLKDRRIVAVTCFQDLGDYSYPAWLPIEGLHAIVDLQAQTVLDIVDTGVVPLSKSPPDFTVKEKRRLAVNPPGNFKVDGQRVTWKNWRFHVRFHQRLGVVVGDVEFRSPKGNYRSVAYSMHISEIFVPYQDPDPNWFYRTYLDAGEYGLGGDTVLQPDLECPLNSYVFSDTLLVNNYSVPVVYACLFEQAQDMHGYQHVDANLRADPSCPPDSSPGICPKTDFFRADDLILKSSFAVGNYDYTVLHQFKQDGSIKVRLASNGIAQVKGVDCKNVEACKQNNGEAYGTLCGENRVATNHDHFFSWRVDVDVDQPENNFFKHKLTPFTTNSTNLSPRTAYWKTESEKITSEKDAHFTPELRNPAKFLFQSTSHKTSLGHSTGFVIVPGPTAVSILDPSTYPMLRAGWSEHTLWVTQHDDKEIYASGPFPNQSPGAGGLTDWVKKNRNLEGKDLVAWYTLGFHHVFREEEGPIMPNLEAFFTLLPFNFFDQNPLLGSKP